MKPIATTKLVIHEPESAREETAGIAGPGIMSDTRRKGTGPRPIAKAAWGQLRLGQKAEGGENDPR
jgi:hypothetical protein